MRREANRRQYVIDASKPWHVAWWAQQLGVSADAVTEAIDRVGVDADAVEDFLRGRSPGVHSADRQAARVSRCAPVIADPSSAFESSSERL